MSLWTPDGERPVSRTPNPASVAVGESGAITPELRAALAEATVAIEALRAVVDRLDDAFGENAAVLRQALSQLQLTFVQLKEHAEAIGESPDA